VTGRRKNIYIYIYIYIIYLKYSQRLGGFVWVTKLHLQFNFEEIPNVQVFIVLIIVLICSRDQGRNDIRSSTVCVVPCMEMKVFPVLTWELYSHIYTGSELGGQSTYPSGSCTKMRNTRRIFCIKTIHIDSDVNLWQFQHSFSKMFEYNATTSKILVCVLGEVMEWWVDERALGLLDARA